MVEYEESVAKGDDDNTQLSKYRDFLIPHLAGLAHNMCLKKEDFLELLSEKMKENRAGMVVKMRHARNLSSTEDSLSDEDMDMLGAMADLLRPMLLTAKKDKDRYDDHI